MKFDKPSVSVIVPVFKVEDYLGRCIYSVVNQTYSDLQIILIDDGSPDECALMCDEWAEKDDRITVIHKLNGGQAEARNYGMQFATLQNVTKTENIRSITTIPRLVTFPLMTG